MRKNAGVLLLAALTSTALLAQRPPPQGGGGVGGSPSGSPGGRPGGTVGQPGQPGRPGQPGTGFPQQNPQRRMPEVIYLSGRVMMDDGTAPTESVVIERVCSGSPRPETYTDRKGRFSFRLGDNSIAMLGDASVSGVPNPGGFPGQGQSNDPFGGGLGGPGGLGGGVPGTGVRGTVDLSGCELQARLAGFRSDRIQLGRRSIFDKPDVGVIVLHRLAKVAGHSVSVTTLAAPKNASKSYEKALNEMRKPNRDPAKAVKELEKAVASYPEFAAAWSMLGELRMGSGDAAGAREAFDKSIAADPKYLQPYFPLVQLELRENNWESAADVSAKLMGLNPMRTDVKYFHAVASFNAGDAESAEETARDIQTGSEAASFPQTHDLLGMIYAQRGDYPKAAAEMRAFLEKAPDSPQAPKIARKLYEWEELGVIQKQTASAE